MIIRILLAARASLWRNRVEDLLARKGHVTMTASDANALWRALRREEIDLVIVDRGILGEAPEVTVDAVRGVPERPEVIVVAESEDPEDRARMLASGCLAVLYGELPLEILESTLAALVERRREESLRRMRAEPFVTQNRLSDFAAGSPAMRQVMAVARRVVATDSSLLVLGETGVGKEWLARAIHSEGPRAEGPFIAVNCGALPENLLETELFGHERGAFTGAVRSRRGHFELAHRGTIFLDEIAEMPSHVQVKLMRVLQERAIQRVGGERSLGVDVRVMAATNRNVPAEIAAGRFRRDLYYRLGVVTITLPPLRERHEDLAELAATYLGRFRERFRREIEGFDPDAMEAMARYGWPGNVRELINVIERAALLCSGRAITLADLPEEIAQGRVATPPGAKPPAPGDMPSFRQGRDAAIARFERDYLTTLLRASGGRVGEAARRAGLSARGLYDLMRRHGVRKEAFRFGGGAGEADGRVDTGGLD